MRTWAASDARAAAAIAWIDQRRLDYLQDLFLQIGSRQLMLRARLAYHSWVGEFTVGIPSSQAERLAEIKLNHAIWFRIACCPFQSAQGFTATPQSICHNLFHTLSDMESISLIPLSSATSDV